MIFVFDNPNLHLYTRGLAIIAAIILIYYGIVYKNFLILLIGLATLIVDSYTFYKSLKLLGFICR